MEEFRGRKTQRRIKNKFGGLCSIPVPGFIRASRHSSSITGCHGGYVAALSPSALFHPTACWAPNGIIQRSGGVGIETHRQAHGQKMVEKLFDLSSENPDGKNCKCNCDMASNITSNVMVHRMIWVHYCQNGMQPFQASPYFPSILAATW